MSGVQEKEKVHSILLDINGDLQEATPLVQKKENSDCHNLVPVAQKASHFCFYFYMLFSRTKFERAMSQAGMSSFNDKMGLIKMKHPFCSSCLGDPQNFILAATAIFKKSVQPSLLSLAVTSRTTH